MSDEIKVCLERNAHKIDLNFESKALGNIKIDKNIYTGEELNGTAKKLLIASALYCFCGAFDKALDVRSVEYKSMKATGHVETGIDDLKRGKIKKLILEIEVELAEDDEETFARCVKIMKSGCLVTASLEPGIEVEYHINPKFI